MVHTEVQSGFDAQSPRRTALVDVAHRLQTVHDGVYIVPALLGTAVRPILLALCVSRGRIGLRRQLRSASASRKLLYSSRWLQTVNLHCNRRVFVYATPALTPGIYFLKICENQ